jgi:hypothetical protein
MVGTIAAIGTDTLTIEVIAGNKLVQGSIGTQVIVTVVPETRYLLKTGIMVAPITFSGLQMGQKVSLNGIFADNTLTAFRVTVGANLTCRQ